MSTHLAILVSIDYILLFFAGGFSADFSSAYSSSTEEKQSTGTGPGEHIQVYRMLGRWVVFMCS